MVDLIISYLKNNKDEIIDALNKKVNIPLISEAKEEQIFSSLFVQVYYPLFLLQLHQ